MRARSICAAAFVAVALIGAASCGSARPDHDVEAQFLSDNSAAMNRMMAGMSGAPSSSVDRDFLELMVPHHQGAIDMAQAELRHGRNATLRAIAQEIIVTEQDEIATMELTLQNLPAAPTPGRDADRFRAENDAAMEKMMSGMHISPSGDIDRDFVAMMVPHHQGAIDMARAELAHGHHGPCLGLAQEIVSGQLQQITAMTAALR